MVLETVRVLGCLRDARRLQDHEKGAGLEYDFAVLDQKGVHFGTPFFRNRALGFQIGRPMIQYGHFLEPKGGPGPQKVAFWGDQKRYRKLSQKPMDFETLKRRKWCSRAGAVRILQKGDVLEKVPKRNQNGAKMHATSDQRRPRTPKERPGGGLRHLLVRFESGPVSEKEGPKNEPKHGPLKNGDFGAFWDFMCKARQSARILSGS
jgi:hypothetical protein